MNKNVLVVAPHPDDEVLGCGGTLLRYIDEGYKVGWLICTEPPKNMNWSSAFIKKRKEDIKKVTKLMNFSNTYELNFPATMLDDIPMSEVVSKISEVFNDFKPNIIFAPHRGDVHTDHRILFDAVNACTKWFRHSSVNELYAYETPSETEFNYKPNNKFNPNTYVNITGYLEKKIEVIKIYESEIDDFPFPRSLKTIESLAIWRGSNSGFDAAEAFEVLFKRS